jgi:hypothetical protein
MLNVRGGHQDAIQLDRDLHMQSTWLLGSTATFKKETSMLLP